MDELPPRFAPCKHLEPQLLVVLDTRKLDRVAVFAAHPFAAPLLGFLGDIGVIVPCGEHIVENVVAGDDAAAVRDAQFHSLIVRAELIATGVCVHIEKLA